MAELIRLRLQILGLKINTYTTGRLAFTQLDLDGVSSKAKNSFLEFWKTNSTIVVRLAPLKYMLAARPCFRDLTLVCLQRARTHHGAKEADRWQHRTFAVSTPSLTLQSQNDIVFPVAVISPGDRDSYKYTVDIVREQKNHEDVAVAHGIDAVYLCAFDRVCQARLI